MTPHFDAEQVQVWHGDCIEVMRGLPDASVDAVVTDPPYGLEFMGKDWDAPWENDPAVGKRWQTGMAAVEMADGGKRLPRPSFEKASNVKCRTCGKWRVSSNPCRCEAPDFPNLKAQNMRAFQSWCEDWAREALRVLKPGGFLIAFGGSRTFHRLTSGIEDAGFEIRDSIGYGHSQPALMAWVQGAGFPKSLNVSKALAEIPPCSCSGGSLAGETLTAVDPSIPTGTVSAGDGTEPRPMPLAGLPADSTRRVRPQVTANTSNRLPDVDTPDVDLDGARLPVVLGPLSVAGATQGHEVPQIVRGIEVHPEALRDQMVGQLGDTTAVPASPIAGDHRVGDSSPLAALVLPLPAAPSGIVGTHEAVPVGDAHAGSGAVVGHVGPAPELGSADDADVDPVPGASHGTQDATERLSKCPACGGRRGAIPEGLGTALKPAWEPIVVARKPLSGTVAQTVLTWGTGALNIDATRIGYDGTPEHAARAARGSGSGEPSQSGVPFVGGILSPAHAAGRWPANAVFDTHTAALLDQQSGVQRDGVAVNRNTDPAARKPSTVYGAYLNGSREDQGYGGTGGASRFFYTAKADSFERPNVDGIAHPTVKPLDLMQWLVRLVTPKGGTVLEPFAGSGTTVEACLREGFRCIAIEREADYLPLIMHRVDKPHAVGLDFGDWEDVS